MDLKGILAELSALSGVAGCESSAAGRIAEYASKLGAVEVTPLGSVICRVWEGAPDRPHLLLDAHMDEVGMIVTHIEDSGFLRVGACGGVDRRVLPASPVLVHGKGGPVTGVICAAPPHLGEGDKKFAKVDELFLDIGYTTEGAEALVSPGDRVSILADFRTLLGDQVSGKALDNRAGCACLLHAAELLKETPPTCGLTLLFSSMEEVGGQGAKTAAWALNPTHAIAVDTTFAHTPGADKTKCGKMGGGPMIGISPLLSGEMSDSLIQTAKAEGIPHQLEVMPGGTGTNADQIATTRAGVRCGLLSIPIKYMHTPVETLALCDLEETGRLLAAFVKQDTLGASALGHPKGGGAA